MSDVDSALAIVLGFEGLAVRIPQVYTVEVVVALIVAVTTNAVSVPVIRVIFLVETLWKIREHPICVLFVLT